MFFTAALPPSGIIQAMGVLGAKFDSIVYIDGQNLRLRTGLAMNCTSYGRNFDDP